MKQNKKNIFNDNFFIKSKPYNKTDICWKIISFIELLFVLIYNLIKLFIPAIMFNIMGQSIISYILCIGAFILLIQQISKSNSLKETYYIIKYYIKNKKGKL